MFRVLAEHEVRYVLIGALAATLHGSPIRTGDADICPARDRQNLERLAAALQEMGARIRSDAVEGGAEFTCDAEFLDRMQLCNLVTDHGDFDLSFVPTGTEGYEDLAERAVLYDLDGVTVPVASLVDVIRSKEAAGRRKDLEALPTLRELLHERWSREGDERS